MFERKLIRHPYGHEEVLIVENAVLRPHDLPLQDLPIFRLGIAIDLIGQIQLWKQRDELEQLLLSRSNLVPTV